MSGSSWVQTAQVTVARRQHTETLLVRVQVTLTAMCEKRAQITVRAVEHRADVSRSLLGQKATARKLISDASTEVAGR
ncbi:MULTISPECIES: hypothetical protein [Streptomyces]|uniref:Uncharacterized protein n=1 Tax=Streptomyces ehimensis TaxID=68195 RepID=A0ABV9BVB1_9ACTN